MIEKETLRRENNTLRELYIELENQKELLQGRKRAQLEALYHAKISSLRLEKLGIQLSINSLKRKITHIRKMVDGNEQPDFTSIALRVAASLSEEEERIAQLSETITHAKTTLSMADRPVSEIQLIRVFKRMAMRLHPDFHSRLSPGQAELWHRVKKAYQCGDLHKLKTIEERAETLLSETASSADMSIPALSRQNFLLTDLIRKIETELGKLQLQFPFNIQEQITNPSWIIDQRNILAREIMLLEKEETDLKQEYERLFRLYG